MTNNGYFDTLLGICGGEGGRKEVLRVLRPTGPHGLPHAHTGPHKPPHEREGPTGHQRAPSLHGPARPGSARPGLARPGPARPGPARPIPGRPELPRTGGPPARPGPAQPSGWGSSAMDFEVVAASCHSLYILGKQFPYPRLYFWSSRFGLRQDFEIKLGTRLGDSDWGRAPGFALRPGCGIRLRGRAPGYVGGKVPRFILRRGSHMQCATGCRDSF